MKRNADVVDLVSERVARMPAVTRFVLEIRDAGSTPHEGVFEWRWTTEDNGDATGQYRPSSQHIASQLRRIANRLDPHPRRRLRVRRAK